MWRWHTADDLVSVALTNLFRHWRRVSKMDNIDAYVRRSLLRAWLNERRRPWRREHSLALVPDRAGGAGPEGVADRLTILALLAELPPRRRQTRNDGEDDLPAVVCGPRNQTPSSV